MVVVEALVQLLLSVAQPAREEGNVTPLGCASALSCRSFESKLSTPGAVLALPYSTIIQVEEAAFIERNNQTTDSRVVSNPFLYRFRACLGQHTYIYICLLDLYSRVHILSKYAQNGPLAGTTSQTQPRLLAKLRGHDSFPTQKQHIIVNIKLDRAVAKQREVPRPRENQDLTSKAPKSKNHKGKQNIQESSPTPVHML